MPSRNALICRNTQPMLSRSCRPAQEKSTETPQPHYKLIYRLLQMGADGKIANSHTYSTIIVATATIRRPKIRTGDKVPIAMGTS